MRVTILITASLLATSLAGCNSILGGRSSGVFTPEPVSLPPSVREEVASGRPATDERAAGERVARSARSATDAAEESAEAKRAQTPQAQPMATSRGVGAGIRF
jgi:hypothetical protein